MLGYDFGYTKCEIGAFRGFSVELVPTETNLPFLYSYVSFDSETKKCIVGDTPKRNALSHPSYTAYAVKRFVGRLVYDPEVTENDRMKYYLFKLTEKDGEWKYRFLFSNPKDRSEIASIYYTPDELATIIIHQCKELGDRFIHNELGKRSKGILTIRTSYPAQQYTALCKSMEKAGIDIEEVISDGISISAKYEFERIKRSIKIMNHNILIYDFGGNSFDAYIVNINEMNKTISVLYHCGNSLLGGNDLTDLVINYYCDLYKSVSFTDIVEDVESMGIGMGGGGDGGEAAAEKRHEFNKLIFDCERAKCDLSTSEYSRLQTCSLFKKFNVTPILSRDELYLLILPKIQQTMDIVNNLLLEYSYNNANTEPIYGICLIGGSSRIPKIKELLHEILPSSIFIDQEIVPIDGANAMGAAIFGNKLLKGWKYFDRGEEVKID